MKKANYLLLFVFFIGFIQQAKAQTTRCRANPFAWLNELTTKSLYNPPQSKTLYRFRSFAN